MKLEYIVKGLIQNNKIKTQTELADILYKRGFNTTQSNISRILKKLNTIKIVDENKETYYVIHSRPLDVNNKIRNLVLSIDRSSTGIVIKTYPNASNIIGQILEERNIDGVMSTICGNNVVLVVPEDTKDIDIIDNKIRSLFLSDR